ncbi:unnamed protein product, partial [Meganyctiphanes norvegica]
EEFGQAIEARLLAKQKKKTERKRLNSGSRQVDLQVFPQNLPPPPQQQQQQQQEQPQPSSKKKKSKKPGKKGKRDIRTLDISTPTNFQHISHVGFDPNQDDNEVLKGFFDIVGVKPEQLSDPNTKAFILDFINQNGGIQKAKEEADLYCTLPVKPKAE